eukprot:686228-Rhodomonas_salina.1
MGGTERACGTSSSTMLTPPRHCPTSSRCAKSNEKACCVGQTVLRLCGIAFDSAGACEHVGAMQCLVCMLNKATCINGTALESRVCRCPERWYLHPKVGTHLVYAATRDMVLTPFMLLRVLTSSMLLRATWY